MRIILTCFLVLVLSISYSQNKFQIILDSGKKEFKAQFVAFNPCYDKAIELFKEASSIKPNDPEAEYFLGYALDKINMVHGMDSVDRKLTEEASYHMELVNKLQPRYTGEYMLLDPYSKLTSNWGSLAFSYLIKGQVDSAKWAFKEGKKRGGYIDAILESSRQLLNSCKNNSILVTVGDNETFPCYYLQYIENFRPDLTVVDGNLIATEWYTKWLKKDKKVKLTYSDLEIDTLYYQKWESTIITISNPDNIKEKLEWELKPTYYGYISNGDKVMLDIVRNYLYKRPIYFTESSDSSTNLFLDNFLHSDGIVKYIDPLFDKYKILNAISPNLFKYSLKNVSQSELTNSKDAILSFNMMRLAYLFTGIKLFGNGQEAKAKEILNEMDKRFPSKSLPFTNEEVEKYYHDVKAAVFNL
jgi:tetratricopeptide (TPR) repeat protein